MKPQQRQRIENQRRILTKLYDHLQIGTPTETSVKALAAATGETHSRVDDAKRVFQAAGVLEVALDYSGGQGITATWSLLTNKEEALARLAEHQEQALAAPKPKPERTVAVVGDDAPSPFESLRPLRRSESAAMVEAARQYREQRNTRSEKLREMREAGLRIDSSLINKAIPVVHDARFDHILLVEPYIAQLEAENERGYRNALNRIEELRTQVETLNREIKPLRTFRDQRLAQEVAETHDRNGREAAVAR